MEGITEFLIMGVPIVIIVPLFVQKALKEPFGMRSEWTAPVSMVTAFCLITLANGAAGAFAVDQIASYVLAGIMYGLGSNGVYSQVQLFRGEKAV